MHVSIRSCLMAGVSLAGATALAITPISPVTGSDIRIPATSSTAVGLTASDTFLAPWVSAFNDASDNATKISQHYFQAPGAAVQQLIVNQADYANTLLNDPGAIGDVFDSVGSNLENLFRGLTLLYPLDVLGGNQTDTARLAVTNDAFHGLMAAVLPAVLGESMDEQTLQIVTLAVQFLSSPLSGVLIGLAGPIVSPVVAALNIATAIVDDPSSALTTLLNAPAKIVNSVLNGATLDLTSTVVPLLAGVMPEGISITHLDVAFGGLLTAGTTALEYGGESTDGIGGSIFNSIGLEVDLGGGIPLPIASNPVGPIGALANLSHIIAKELGWDGVGNPLTTLTFPKITPAPEPEPEIAPQQELAKVSNEVGNRDAAAVEAAGTATPEAADSPEKAAKPAKAKAKKAGGGLGSATKKVRDHGQKAGERVKNTLNGKKAKKVASNQTDSTD